MSSVFAQRRQKLLSLKALRGSSPAPAHTEEACPACGKAAVSYTHLTLPTTSRV